MNYLKKFYIYFLLCVICFSSAGSEKNYYEILSVSSTADQEEITKAYRQLALKHHPDRNIGDETAHEKMAEINSAYNVLKDPQQRQEYDRVLESKRAREQYERSGSTDSGVSIKDINIRDVTFVNSMGLATAFESIYSMHQSLATVFGRTYSIRPEDIQASISAGADLEAKTEKGETPLHIAVIYSQNDEERWSHNDFTFYRFKRAELRELGGTDLHINAMDGGIDAMRIFVLAGADLEAKTNEGWTALHLAAKHNYLSAIRILVSAGADLEAKTNDGKTPLGVAVERNLYHKLNADGGIRFLLSAGANPEAKDNQLQTPLSIAKSRGMGHVFRQEIRKRRKAHRKTRFHLICQGLFSRLTQ